jgi:hypothetical protein
MFQLPQVLQSFIYEFDSTYRKQFDRCLVDIKKMNPMVKDITEDQIIDPYIWELFDINCEDFDFTIDYQVEIDLYEYTISRKNEWKDFSKASRKLLSQILVSTFPTMSQDPDNDFSFTYETKTDIGWTVEAMDGTLEDYYELFDKMMGELRA